ncbi:hydrogenase maturation nickel metallochaperone HypA [Biostraticola tofi]|uniref:Hydrogenase maturation factor HypA n=1 Tax=Biostraticola tofi TaxID=466109 RepID=A0A4R3Z2V2_9GAMM|nr:hydrogenase maturation nickel metallochaperone HypA [Biostraticola tofi]TCV99267.1 hydrogenase nickel incorporation protein HypA/HybF [Biostraticola tofi]
MHEITLCQHALDIMLQHAVRQQAQRIRAVWLEIGAFSCVEAEALRFCFDVVCRDTLAQGCQLHIDQQQAHCWCHDCQREVELLAIKVVLCPLCGSRNLQVDADDGMTIKRMEIE